MSSGWYSYIIINNSNSPFGVVLSWTKYNAEAMYIIQYREKDSSVMYQNITNVRRKCKSNLNSIPGYFHCYIICSIYFFVYIQFGILLLSCVIIRSMVPVLKSLACNHSLSMRFGYVYNHTPQTVDYALNVLKLCRLMVRLYLNSSKCMHNSFTCSLF